MTQAAGLVVLPNAHWHYFWRNLAVGARRRSSRSRDALGVSGAAMAVRTEWFLENGGFDESFVNGFEDVDLCMRAREQGRAIAYVADARFAHYEAASAGRFDREAENERRFYRRWSARHGIAAADGARRGRRNRGTSSPGARSAARGGARGSRGRAARVRSSDRARRDRALAPLRSALSPRGNARMVFGRDRAAGHRRYRPSGYARR